MLRMKIGFTLLTLLSTLLPLFIPMPSSVWYPLFTLFIFYHTLFLFFFILIAIGFVMPNLKTSLTSLRERGLGISTTLDVLLIMQYITYVFVVMGILHLCIGSFHWTFLFYQFLRKAGEWL